MLEVRAELGAMVASGSLSKGSYKMCLHLLKGKDAWGLNSYEEGLSINCFKKQIKLVLEELG